MNNNNLSRVQREQQFHNKRFTNPNLRQSKVARFYHVTQSIRESYMASLLTKSSNSTVVEYGCGTGSCAFQLSMADTRSVIGIDISSVAIEQAQAEANLLNCPSHLSFQVMNAENLEFESNSIDLICGTGILHHLDLHKSMQSIIRVLKSDGHAIFIEPLGHNIFINAFRFLTPSIRSDDEHPLLGRDLEIFHQYFNKVEIHYFYLTSLFASILVGTSLFRKSLYLLEQIDGILLNLPLVRLQAWQVLIKLSSPIKSSY
jgi:ubiquinone/menaquinone biosynthesis C-methylase UbiE